MQSVKNIIKALVLIISSTFITTLRSYSQCSTVALVGQNMITNGTFSSGYTGWTYDSPYTIRAGAWSVSGDIIVGTNPNADFNSGFDTYGDHTSGSGNFLMVDGLCNADGTIKVWSQTVSGVTANTTYIFSVWISSLKNMATYPGNLNFNIGGTDVGTNILAPSLGGASASNGTNTGGGWIQYSTTWNSGATSGNVVISIQNNNTTACGSEVDFALDDIEFNPYGPQPNLGVDQSICGKGGSITLDANVTHNATTTVTWNDGTTGTGLGAPYTKVITAAGTYSVCVTDNGSTVKSDIINVTNTVHVDIGADVNLCNTTTAELDAVFTGTGVTYQWYKNHPTLAPGNSTSRTYSANSAGTYRVDVMSTECATATSTMTVTSSNTQTPVDAYYCPPSLTPTLSVTGSGTYVWYDALTGGNIVQSGLSYTLPTITNSPATQTYYVQDNDISTGTLGPTALITTGSSNDFYPGNIPNNIGAYFTINSNFTVNSFKMPIRIDNPNGTTNMTVSFNYSIVKADGSALTTPITGTTSTETIPYNTSSYALFTFTTSGLNITTADGSALRIMITGKTSNYEDWRWKLESRTSLTNPYPYNSTIPGVASITSSYSYGSQTTYYSGLYNWAISSATTCARTPVRAINTCVLPVEWLSFDVKLKNGVALIDWSTSEEVNNKYYSIERSIDGVNFETIGIVDGKGNYSDISLYQFTDNYPLSGVSYYRVVQHDFDEKTTTSDMITLNNDGVFVIDVFPNPFNDNSTLIVYGLNSNEQFAYNLCTVLGQNLETGVGQNQQKISFGKNLAKGVYFLTINYAGIIKTVKVIKN